MIISEVIRMLEEAKEKHGDIEVYVDMDYGQRAIQKDNDPICRCPEHEDATVNMPERLVI